VISIKVESEDEHDQNTPCDQQATPFEAASKLHSHLKSAREIKAQEKLEQQQERRGYQMEAESS